MISTNTVRRTTFIRCHLLKPVNDIIRSVIVSYIKGVNGYGLERFITGYLTYSSCSYSTKFASLNFDNSNNDMTSEHPNGWSTFHAIAWLSFENAPIHAQSQHCKQEYVLFLHQQYLFDKITALDYFSPTIIIQLSIHYPIDVRFTDKLVCIRNRLFVFLTWTLTG
jgi:hypothetical protein